MPRTRTIAGFAAVSLAVSLTLASIPPAVAHDGLIGASPEPGATVSSELDQVSLDFSEDFLDLGGMTNAFAIQVAGPDGNYYTVGCVAIEPSRLSIATHLGESGTYTVVWQIVSSDGHPTSDRYQFTFERPSGTPAAEGSALADTCTPPDTPSPTPSAISSGEPPGDASATEPPLAPAANASSPCAPLALIFGVVAVAALATAIALLIRRRRALERGGARPGNSSD